MSWVACPPSAQSITLSRGLRPGSLVARGTNVLNSCVALLMPIEIRTMRPFAGSGFPSVSSGTIARAIVPLDTLGNPDPANGRIVLISIGMSNATQEFSTFVPLATSDPGRNPRLNVIDCAEGGQATQDIRTAGAPYWDTVAARLRAHGSAPLQAQV